MSAECSSCVRTSNRKAEGNCGCLRGLIGQKGKRESQELSSAHNPPPRPHGGLARNFAFARSLRGKNFCFRAKSESTKLTNQVVRLCYARVMQASARARAAPAGDRSVSALHDPNAQMVSPECQARGHEVHLMPII